MSRTGRFLAFLIVFVGGYSAALPVAGDIIRVPVIFTQFQVAYGVFLRDALLLAYLALFVMFGSLPKVRMRPDEVRFAVLIVGLGLAGILSAVVNLTTVLDIGEALRLFLFAGYFCISLHWARVLGANFLIRAYLVGIAVGGVINIYYTFQAQFMTIGILPFLLGQNGPGGFLSLGVLLGAWLMLIQRSRLDVVVAMTASLVGLFATSISYSRLSMLMASCGVVAWIAVILSASTSRHTSRRGLVLLGLAVSLVVALNTTTLGQEYVTSVRGFVNNKFGVIDINDPNSVGTRYQYFFAVFEILQQHPITGVGYSGFYDAVTTTRTYQSGLMADEQTGIGFTRLSNPHNAFLYYVSSNGLIGLVTAGLIFGLFLLAAYRSLAPYGTYGQLVWACVAGAFFVNAMTLPTMFNTEVMYLPAAFAFSQIRAVHNRPGFTGTRKTWSSAAA